MKLVFFGEKEYYISETTTPAAHKIGSYLGIPVSTPGFRCLRGFATLEESVLIIHAAYLKICEVKVRDLRARCPKSKIVTLGTDCVHYLPFYEFDSPVDVDLHLDTLTEVVDFYRANGIRADKWIWTAAENTLERLSMRERRPKVYDASCIINITNDYRQRLYNHCRNSGLSVRFGGFGGTADDVYDVISSSWVNLGTTSPNWPRCRTMKGWRDWVAPHLGTPLIYDDHPDVISGFGDYVPIYRYDNFDSMVGCVRRWIGSSDYQKLIEAQQIYVMENSIEKQLIARLNQYGII